MEKSRKVVFVTGSLSGGGAEKVISILANECARANIDTTIVVLREKKQSYFVSSSVRVIQLQDKKGGKILRRIKELRAAIKRLKPDVVIPFLPTITVYTVMANIGLGTEMIMSERGDPYRAVFDKALTLKDQICTLIMRRMGLMNLAKHIVFQTPDAKAFYSKRIQSKSTIIPNPLDVARLPEANDGTREKRIVAAGRFNEVKNFELLITAFAKFQKEYPKYRLTLYGEGKLENEYKKLIKSLKIEDYVDLPGFSDQLQEDICNAGMYISTSNHEGISNSMLEALAMGIPTIVTDCPVGGSKMFVHTNQNGILIPMNDEKALLEAMLKIARDEKFAQNLSQNARKIRDDLCAEKIWKRWEEII